MNKIISPALILFFLVNPFVVYAGSEWYENGTLHSASVAEWNAATYSNRLATAADMALSRPQIKAKVKNSGSIDTLRPFAIELLSCVNEAAAGPGYGSMRMAELAASCMILMGW
ncbi:MAG: hypothetical protein JW883_03055 [Deltaproteobacteria bacterium]|nr:hypothetical protein [Deltaproteobacteria bacterium]